MTAITVGVNAASLPPAVPKVFLWSDTATGQDIIAMWHPYGDWPCLAFSTLPHEAG